MELLLLFVALIVFDLATMRFGADSRSDRRERGQTDGILS